MEVRYNPKAAYFFFVLGALNIVLGGYLTLVGRFNFTLLIGIWSIVLGVLYLKRVYFTINEREVVVRALYGPVKRVTLIPSPADIKTEKNNLYVMNKGKWKKVVGGWLCHSEDWYNLEVYVQQLNQT